MSKSFLSQRHRLLDEYTPGEQPQDMEYIKLNTNESPYPPPESVIKAAAYGAERLNLYPDPDGSDLLEEIAQLYNLKKENVIIGNGSDELLAFSFHAFCDDKRPIAFPDITYGFYPVYSMLYGVPYSEIPLDSDFQIHAADYLKLGKNIVIANPNAPTGLFLPLSDIELILRNNPENVVIIDEAYIDFGGDSAVSLIPKYDNLLVMHTFSKSRALAGARLAYAMGQRGLIGDLNKMKFSFNPYNVSRTTQAMGLAALRERTYYLEKCREIIETRAETTALLRNKSFTVTQSHGNFVFAASPEIPGAQLYSLLKQQGILVRHFNKNRISDYIRITIGTKHQMSRLLEALT